MNDIKHLLNPINFNLTEDEINNLLNYWLTVYDKVFHVINYELLLYLEQEYSENEKIYKKINTLKKNIAETYYNKKCLINKVFSNQNYYKNYNRENELRYHADSFIKE